MLIPSHVLVALHGGSPGVARTAAGGLSCCVSTEEEPPVGCLYSVRLVAVCVGLAASFARPATPQETDTLVLDLDGARAIALANSFRIQEVSLDLERDQWNARAVRAGLKSNASLTLTTPEYEQAITEQFNSSTSRFELFSTTRARYRSELRIGQPLPSNGEIALSYILFRQLNQPFNWAEGEYTNRLSLSFHQPFFTPNQLQIDIKRAELRLEETRLRFTGRRVELIAQVSQRFYRLLGQTLDVELLEEAVSRAERNYAVGQRLHAEGTLRELDLLQLEVDLTRRQEELAEARGDLERDANAFAQFLGLPSGLSAAVEMDTSIAAIDLDAEEAVRRGMSRRVELRQREILAERSELDVRARHGWNGFAGEVRLSLGLDSRDTTLSGLFDRPDQARGISVNFYLPLWDWGRRDAFIAAARVEERKRQLALDDAIRSVQRSVRDDVARVREARERLGILRRSVVASERSYELSLTEFEAGRLGPQELSLAESRFREARDSHREAFQGYKLALISLMEATYWDYERDRPIAGPGSDAGDAGELF